MPKVYITQIPHKTDVVTGDFVPSINISPAQEHGEIVVMLPHQTSFYATGELVRRLRKHLTDYNYEAGDALIALGDPSVIAVASALLGRMHGTFLLLKWDRHLSRYTPSHIKV